MIPVLEDGQLSNDRLQFTNHNKSIFKDLFIEGELLFQGNRLCIPSKCHFLQKSSERWLTFPVLYNELSTETELRLTVWGCAGPRKRFVVGGTTIPLFSDDLVLKAGERKVILYVGKKPSEKTLGIIHGCDELIRIKQHLAKNRSLTTRWLDGTTKATIDELLNDPRLYQHVPVMNLEFQMFAFPVVHTKQEQTLIMPDYISSLGKDNKKSDKSKKKQKKSDQFFVSDLEINQSNPAADKYLILSLSSDAFNDDSKPSNAELKQLQQIASYSPLQEITLQEKTLLWRFRKHLRTHKRIFIKFLKSIDWGLSKVVKEATRVLEEWGEIDTVDVLALLSRFFQKVYPVRKFAMNTLQKTDDETILDMLLQLVQTLRYESTGENSELATFLIERAKNNFEIANNLSWYLKVEMSDPKFGQLFEKCYQRLTSELSKEFVERLERQQKLIDYLIDISKKLSLLKNRKSKITEFENILKKDHPYNWTQLFSQPIELPLAPSKQIIGFIPSKAYVFKSAKTPMLVPFKLSNDEPFMALFKCGDDLRQDQLILQLINLMNKLLIKNGLDLKLTPYKVLATSVDTGFVECILPSEAISSIINIQAYLKKHNPDKESFEQACETFVRSCAGYCVITYILGIGDRHLDNILLTPQGNLFHIDFGFILGRDPKPFPPQMKLCKEMVDGMGGRGSKGYEKFKGFCCTAFNILRHHAGLIINLFILMADANIPDLSRGVVDPMKNVMRVQDKFKLELNDVEAIAFMQNVIDESEKALFPQITETFHRVAQYWRS